MPRATRNQKESAIPASNESQATETPRYGLRGVSYRYSHTQAPYTQAPDAPQE